MLTVIAPDIDIGEAKTNHFIPRSINGWSSAPDIRHTAAINHAVSSSNFLSASTFSRSVRSSGLSLSIYSLKTPSQSSNIPSRRTSAASFVNPGPLTIHGSGIDVDGPTNYDTQIPLLTESSGEEENLIVKCESVVSKALSAIQFKDIFPINAIPQKTSEWKRTDRDLSLGYGNENLTPLTLSKQFEAPADNATNIYHDLDHSFINNCYDSGRFCDVVMESQNQIGALCSIIASVNEYQQASQAERTWYSVSTRPEDLEISTSLEEIDDLLVICTDYMRRHQMEQSSKSSSEKAICSRIAVTGEFLPRDIMTNGFISLCCQL